MSSDKLINVQKQLSTAVVLSPQAGEGVSDAERLVAFLKSRGCSPVVHTSNPDSILDSCETLILSDAVRALPERASCRLLSSSQCSRSRAVSS